eukprot:TRINITY_DN68661_c0_g1_i1.p1 TRINITY_DN68661_c0_g1~~TRINITY_DN68661_c0_g1_i1.p1  ORF type:complete len:435 (+),score=54.29 TRINITY_DN68661_c0_g1_i1:50-1306(+)
MTGCGSTLAINARDLPAAWVHNHHHKVRSVTCLFYAVGYLVIGVRLFFSLTTFMAVVCIASGLAFLLVFAFLQMRGTPAWLLEVVIALICVLPSISALIVLMAWDCRVCGYCLEVRGRAYGIYMVFTKSVLVTNGLRLRQAFVLLTLLTLCEGIYIYASQNYSDQPGGLGPYIASLTLYLGYIATSAARHHELLLIYTATNQLSIQMETVETLATQTSDALVWLEADGNRVAKDDNRFRRWLGSADKSSAQTYCLSDFMSSEAFAQLRDILTSPKVAPVDVLPTELRHVSGAAIQARLAIVDQRSCLAGGTETVKGFLVAVTIMDYASEIHDQSEAVQVKRVQGPVLKAFSETTSASIEYKSTGNNNMAKSGLDAPASRDQSKAFLSRRLDARVGGTPGSLVTILEHIPGQVGEECLA